MTENKINSYNDEKEKFIENRSNDDLITFFHSFDLSLLFLVDAKKINFETKLIDNEKFEKKKKIKRRKIKNHDNKCKT